MNTNLFRIFRTSVAISVAATTLCLSASALADDDGDARREDSDSPREEATESSSERAVEKPRRRDREEPVEARDREGAPKDETSDHDKMVGHLAVGFYGVSDVPVGVSASGVDIVSAPALGVRYWVSNRVGIDAALGLNFGSTTVETTAGATSTTTDIPTPYGVMLHGGVPIAVTTLKHAAILITPELNLGFGGSTVPADPAVMNDTETSNSGLVLQLGARAGAEVHFGFVGLPNLSLEGSVGLYLNHVSASQEKGDVSAKVSQTGFATTSFNNPWDFFASSVAARYYF